VPAVSGTKLMRLAYPDRGLELLPINRVMAIFLRGASAPPLQIRGAGVGSSVSLLKLGASEDELVKAIGDDFEVIPLTDPAVLYRFYPKIGVAVQLNSGVVEEIVLTQATVE